MEIKKGRCYVYGIQYHIVWCTKYRKKILVGEVEEFLKNIVREKAIEHNFVVESMETDEDHIHILVSCTPVHYIPDLMKMLKGSTARLLFSKFPELKKQLWGGHLWNPSYFDCTVSEHTESQVKKYIEEQQVKKQKRGRPTKY